MSVGVVHALVVGLSADRFVVGGPYTGSQCFRVTAGQLQAGIKGLPGLLDL